MWQIIDLRLKMADKRFLCIAMGILLGPMFPRSRKINTASNKQELVYIPSKELFFFL